MNVTTCATAIGVVNRFNLGRKTRKSKRSVRNLLSTLLEEKRKRLTLVRKSAFCVVPPGIEPGTQGFSVLCSTN